MSDTLTDNDWCEINRTTITKMYDTLTRDIDCTKYFPSLRSTFVLTADDCDEIREERTRKKMVMKFLDLLTKKEKRTVVEELLRAIGKDKTMPQLRMKLMKAFVETKEEYKRTHGKREATPLQQNGARQSGLSADTDDMGPLPPLPNPVDRRAMSDIPRNHGCLIIPGPPPSSHNTKSPRLLSLSSTSTGPIPPRPRMESEGRQEGVPAINRPRESYATAKQDSSETSDLSVNMSLYPQSNSTTTSSLHTMSSEAMNGSKTTLPSRSTDFSTLAQHQSTFDYSSSVSSPMSGDNDQDWSRAVRHEALDRFGSRAIASDASCGAGDN